MIMYQNMLKLHAAVVQCGSHTHTHACQRIVRLTDPELVKTEQLVKLKRGHIKKL